MSEVRVKENESLESALKRFKRQCARAGVMAEVRKREHYEKPSVKRKKKAELRRHPAGAQKTPRRWKTIRGAFFYWRCLPKK